MKLNKKQEAQVKKQIVAHDHSGYKIDIELASGHVLNDFKVLEKVLRPEKMTALYLAKWLFFNNGIFRNKTVIDMGSGTGIQGIVCGLYGANKVLFSDI